MDYDKLKQEIAQIADIAATVPEAFRERCFELLLTNLLANQSGAPDPDTVDTPDPSMEGGQGDGGGDSGGGGGGVSNGRSDSPIPIQSQVRVLLQRTGVTQAHLQRVLLFEDGQVHFVRDPESKSIAAGQAEWALLMALKSGIERNKLEADPEAVRSICQDRGFYDGRNFSTNFKSPKTASYFKGVLEPQGEPQGLTGEGQDALGALVKRMAGPE
jgi:hypothetical protein